MTPDAVKYQMTLENEERLRMRTWRPGDHDVDYDEITARPARWSDVAVTPTSRLIVWMLRLPNQRCGEAIAALLVPAYLAVAYGLWQWAPPSGEVALLAVLGIAVALWNAAKFTVAGIVGAALLISGPTAPSRPSGAASAEESHWRPSRVTR
ncbi:hypothetical protein L1785_13550 [Antribacter sp. KLBMP9083]|uniref:Uncharacterized protein n=1 Tax=Antribacter soli TaxID=2910976 RepID=A0AA41QF57_9MICO|nr:hypothetical protein [Antribacter soli]MCF4122003.1 hypothetical protein [Antribacter soli]